MEEAKFRFKYLEEVYYVNVDSTDIKHMYIFSRKMSVNSHNLGDFIEYKYNDIVDEENSRLRSSRTPCNSFFKDVEEAKKYLREIFERRIKEQLIISKQNSVSQLKRVNEKIKESE